MKPSPSAPGPRCPAPSALVPRSPTLRRVGPRVALAALLVASLAACGGDDEVGAGSSPAPSSAVSAPTPTATGTTGSTSPTAAATGSPATPEPTAALEAFPADTSDDTAESSGASLSVVAIRVAKQEGYDRVVFELGGTKSGQPGWTVGYTADPRQDGSGDAVDVKGPETLSVVLTGIGVPADTGVPETTTDPSLPSGLGVVQDVQFSSNFEGQYGAFIGTGSKAPFRVFRLSGPERVVIDVRSS